MEPTEVIATEDWQHDALHIVLRRRVAGGAEYAYLAFDVTTTGDRTDAPGLWDWQAPADAAAYEAAQPGIRLHLDDARALQAALATWFGVAADTQALTDERDVLRADATDLADDLTTARHDAVVAQMEASQWEVLAIAKDEQMADMRATLSATRAHLDDTRSRLEALENPPKWTTGADLGPGLEGQALDMMDQVWQVPETDPLADLRRAAKAMEDQVERMESGWRPLETDLGKAVANLVETWGWGAVEAALYNETALRRKAAPLVHWESAPNDTRRGEELTADPSRVTCPECRAHLPGSLDD